MNKPKDGNLTKKDLASRWGITVRSVERTIKNYNLVPFDWHGRQPEFHPADVAGMEDRRRAHRIETKGGGQGGKRIVTVKEAKRLAKGGRR